MTLHIAALVFPGVTQLDLTAPLQVFAGFPDTRVHLMWHRVEPVPTDSGFSILPTIALAETPAPDLLFVPGGGGVTPLLDDEELLDALHALGSPARWVTSVCTGSFLLGAAGLLDGYRATSHWASLPMLAELGALPVEERVVVDRTRITGAGVTSGLDFALTVAAELFGEPLARDIQLQLEYDPDPPFRHGSARQADPAVVAAERERMRGVRLGPVRRAAARRASPSEVATTG